MQKDLTKENSAIGKNKFKVKSKILVLGFILFVIFGIFSPIERVRAEIVVPSIDLSPKEFNMGDGTEAAKVGPLETAETTAAAKPPTPEEKAFADEVEKRSCINFTNVDLAGCVLKISNLVFVTIPAYLLAQVAFFFNILISVTLSSTLLKDTFVSDAWAVVRDLSNIFFILILLYISIKIILGMGGSEVKKMIGSVVIMALLINFSMFFTQIIIDSSNILALIFYNKINVSTTVAGQTEPRAYSSVGGEKDVSGGMVSAFNPTTMVGSKFIEQAKRTYDVKGNFVKEDDVPTGTMIALTLLSGLIMGIAIYALIVSGLSFLGRLIELWILIIFSPFAFMSYTVPKLASIDYLGWDKWFARLIKVSFMAPIFMFLLYFIFMLIDSNLFTKLIQPSEGTNDAAGTIKMLLGVVMPAIFICILLIKATKFAKEGAGTIGEMVMKGAKMAGGVVGGLALGGTALALQKGVGGGVGSLATKAGKWAEEKDGRFAKYSGEKLKDFGAFTQKSSFDVRGVKIAGKDLSGTTGMKLGEASKGSWTETKKQQVEKRIKRADELEKRGTGKEREELEEAQAKLNEATIPVKLDLEKIDKVMEGLRKNLNDAVKTGDTKGKEEAEGGLILAKQSRKEKTDKLKPLQDEVLKKQKDLNIKGGEIRTDYAESIKSGMNKNMKTILKAGALGVAGALTGGVGLAAAGVAAGYLTSKYSRAAEDEAARKIRIGTSTKT